MASFTTRNKMRRKTKITKLILTHTHTFSTNHRISRNGFLQLLSLSLSLSASIYDSLFSIGCIKGEVIYLSLSLSLSLSLFKQSVSKSKIEKGSLKKILQRIHLLFVYRNTSCKNRNKIFEIKIHSENIFRKFTS